MMSRRTYLIELTDDAKTGKLVIPIEKLETQRPAAEFVFGFLGAQDPARVARERHLSESDLRLLQHLRKMVFTNEGTDLVIRDGISFEANRAILDPDAMLEEYFLKRQKPSSDHDVYTCQIEVLSHDPERGRKRQMLAYQVLFVVHQFKRNYQTTAADVDQLRELTDEAEQRQLLQFDMAKTTFVLTPQGEMAHESLMAEAQELIIRYDIFSDVDTTSDDEVLFETRHGSDLRVPIYELAGINPFRARFVLGLSDGEWDNMPDWPARITDSRWFDEVFDYIEQCPTIEEIGRDRLEGIFDEGKRVLRGHDPVSDEECGDSHGYQAGYNDPYFASSAWWLLFLL